ncbi:phosphoglycerate kinase [Candidatus Woesearchaeota archaeon]|nr:phosphoglycerate kinase [Candidatus Woesearchaeota archaeon]
MASHYNYRWVDELGALRGKTVFARFEYNVKVKGGKIKGDDAVRIEKSLGTLNYLLQQGARVVIGAHRGRPQEELRAGTSFEAVRENNSMKPVASHLESLLKWEKGTIKVATDCIGGEVQKMIEGLNDGEILMLGNLRLYAEEENNDAAFAAKLRELCDIYVFDAFGVAHRANASVAECLLQCYEKGDKPYAFGFLMREELSMWDGARNLPGRKLLAVGGIKLKEKIEAAARLSPSVDYVLAGGAVFNAAVNAKGIHIGKSMITDAGQRYVLLEDSTEGDESGREADKAVRKLIAIKNLLLPGTVTYAKPLIQEGMKPAYTEIHPDILLGDGIPLDYAIMDVIIGQGEKKSIEGSDVILWFGNIGASDIEVNGKFPFSRGTEAFKRSIRPNAYVIVGGGDSVAASEGLENRHVSTGGGAAIKYFTSGTLEALEAFNGNRGYFLKKK